MSSTIVIKFTGDVSPEDGEALAYDIRTALGAVRDDSYGYGSAYGRVGTLSLVEVLSIEPLPDPEPVADTQVHSLELTDREREVVDSFLNTLRSAA